MTRLRTTATSALLAVGLGFAIVVLLIVSVIGMGVDGPPTGLTLAYLVALLLSVGAAAALYVDFPEDYELLRLEGWTAASVYWLIPTAQVLAIHVALTAVWSHRFDPIVHTLAVGVYFFLFVVWDVILIGADKRDNCSCQKANGSRSADQFQRKVEQYLYFVDLPTFIGSLLGGYVFWLDRCQQDDQIPFITGVATAQSLAALIAMGRKLSEVTPGSGPGAAACAPRSDCGPGRPSMRTAEDENALGGDTAAQDEEKQGETADTANGQADHDRNGGSSSTDGT